MKIPTASHELELVLNERERGDLKLLTEHDGWPVFLKFLAHRAKCISIDLVTSTQAITSHHSAFQGRYWELEELSRRIDEYLNPAREEDESEEYSDERERVTSFY